MPAYRSGTGHLLSCLGLQPELVGVTSPLLSSALHPKWEAQHHLWAPEPSAPSWASQQVTRAVKLPKARGSLCYTGGVLLEMTRTNCKG